MQIPPVTAAIQERLNLLVPPLAPLAEHSRRWLGKDDNLGRDGVCCICRTPEVAPLAYRFRIYPAAMKEWLDSARNGFISPAYRSVLKVMNGCFAYGLSLYGLPPSMQADRPMTNRMALQPLDLGQANQFWKSEFAGITPSEFHFGSRHYSYTENVGYFEASDGNMRAVQKNGETVARWSDFATFLHEELDAASAYDAKARD